MHQDKRLKHIVELGLPPLLFAVLVAISRFANWRDHRCKIRLATIARTAVTSQRSVSRALVALRKAGHIEIESGQHDRTSSEFIVLPRMLDHANLAKSDHAKLANRTNYHYSTKLPKKPPTHIAGMPACPKCRENPSSDGDTAPCLKCIRLERKANL